MKRYSKGFAPIIVLVVVIFAGVVGFFVYKNRWISYKNSESRFSFQYPASWYYVPKSYNISGTWIPVGVGLYPVSKEKLESDKKSLISVNMFWLTFYNEKISDFMDSDFEIISSNHTFFGKTDIVTNKYCLKAGVLGKGNIPQKANTKCETHSLIDIGGFGVIETSTFPINQGNTADIKIYEKVLSTLKFSN